LKVEMLEARQLLSVSEPMVGPLSVSAIDPDDITFEVVAKAQPDEWYNGIGGPYVAFGDHSPGAEGKPKVNQTYAWGMA
jgi:hypothetical protein